LLGGGGATLRRAGPPADPHRALSIAEGQAAFARPRFGPHRDGLVEPQGALVRASRRGRAGPRPLAPPGVRAVSRSRADRESASLPRPAERARRSRARI